jgi:hypothetical protein
MPEPITMERAHEFYLDWECACNLCEDEMGGHIHGPWVRAWMLQNGWSQEDIDRREEYRAVREDEALVEFARGLFPGPK